MKTFRLLLASLSTLVIAACIGSQGSGVSSQGSEKPLASARGDKTEERVVLPALTAKTIITSLAPEPFLLKAPTAHSQNGDQTFVTVYNSNLGLVKDVRTITLDKGVNEVHFTGVPTGIDASSVKLRDLTDVSTSVLEQNYRYDLVSQAKLLEQAIDQEIEVTVEEGDGTRSVEGTLLSAGDGIVLKTDNGIEAYKSVIGFSLDSIKNLVTKPTLVWLLQAASGGSHLTETSYLTSGLSWRADYVAVLGAGDTQLDLKGWTTITNRSGAAYENAQLQLVAGSVNRVQKHQPVYARNMAMPTMAMDAEMGGGFEEESLFEYHLYTLGRMTNLRDREEKQIALLGAEDVAFEKRYVFDAHKSHDKVRSELRLDNEKEQGLGMPLPAGVVRAFKADASGQLQFIGEDRIDHTPDGKQFDLFLGNVFDVSVEKKVMESRPLQGVFGRKGQVQEIEVTFENSKDDDIVITIVEKGWGHSIEVSDIDARKIDALTSEIDVSVPSGEEVTVKYTVKTVY